MEIIRCKQKVRLDCSQEAATILFRRRVHVKLKFDDFQTSKHIVKIFSKNPSQVNILKL